MENQIASPIDYEALMSLADPDNTGQAINLITFDPQIGKFCFYFYLICRLPSLPWGTRNVTIWRSSQP